ncbi:MAG: hypothetical protein IEMM0002_0804 [bacterium]|nr:MAG: hypothetical protein IEMM0002_0804 [bacterium]
MKALKDIYYGPEFFRKLAGELHSVYPRLKAESFYHAAIDGLDNLELKERMVRTSQTCKAFLPKNYRKALDVLYALSENIKPDFSYIFIPDFIARYGLDEYDLSLAALKHFTRFESSEFAIRVFLQKDFNKTIKLMRQWSEDENLHVRRLASEGSRPRLPWSFRLNKVIEDPSLTLPILERLKADKEKYVQKSVANHLNDISKDNPEWMLALMEKWNLQNGNTAWIIKRASRSLIKESHPRALALFGFTKRPKISLEQFRLDKRRVTIGGELRFSFILNSRARGTQKLVIDYKIHYVKKSGGTRPKVFKLREVDLPHGLSVNIDKKHLFRNFTTRKHYPGKHGVEIVINGQSMLTRGFQLTAESAQALIY